jgi:hypothetical protein
MDSTKLRIEKNYRQSKGYSKKSVGFTNKLKSCAVKARLI